MLGLGGGKGEMLTADVEEGTSPISKNAVRKNRRLGSRIKCFGVELSPDNIAVAMVYFVQGVLGLSRLAVSFYLKDDLHLDPAEVCPFLYVSFFLKGCLFMSIYACACVYIYFCL